MCIYRQFIIFFGANTSSVAFENVLHTLQMAQSSSHFHSTLKLAILTSRGNRGDGNAQGEYVAKKILLKIQVTSW